MKDQYLHIVSFDIPFPANYGGAMVVFYGLKALHDLGVKIILHCFQYRDRTPQAELEKYCDEVNYYPRRTSLLTFLDFLGKEPYISRSRRHNLLLQRLVQDNYPILLEGLHCCSYLSDGRLRHRQKIVRMHNVEWQYYKNLETLEKIWWKKRYFRQESRKLQAFERLVLAHADTILAISPDDFQYFEQMRKNQIIDKPILFLPPFHPNERIESLNGHGDYVLFHGDLSVSDNELAALWLIKSVFANTQIPLIIAGKNPSQELIANAAEYTHIRLFPNPTDSEMGNLIRNAHINLLWSFQKAGMKLKLINALFRGRFCIANNEVAENTGMEKFCYICNNATTLHQAVIELMKTNFSDSQVKLRDEYLLSHFSNRSNGQKLMDLL